MGRAERRRMERANRIQANKERPIRLSQGDLSKIKREATETAIEANAEVLFTCFALVLHERFGFGKQRILRAMQGTDEYFGKLAHDEITFGEMKDKLRDGAGVEISLSD